MYSKLLVHVHNIMSIMMCVFSIMETLLLNAKLKLFRVGDSHGVELCDT